MEKILIRETFFLKINTCRVCLTLPVKPRALQFIQEQPGFSAKVKFVIGVTYEKPECQGHETGIV